MSYSALNFSRGKDSGGLIQQQHAGVIHQRFKDLDALLQRQLGQLPDDGVRIEIDAIALQRACGMSPSRRSALRRSPLATSARLWEPVNGLTSLKCWMNHADAIGYRIGRLAVDHLASSHRHATFTLFVHAVQNIHQGRLAGPVLAQERVDLALDKNTCTPY